MHVTAIVLAAGKGKRLKSGIPKPLVKIGSKPIIVYCLEILSRHALVSEIVLVVNAANEKGIISAINKYRISKVSRIVRGGKRRQDSVFNALETIGDNTGLVLIHDGVRPFIDKKLVSGLIKQARITGAAIAAVPVKATIKKVAKNRLVEKTFDRGSLWEIQTPQVFKRELIRRAYKRFGKFSVTDDSMLVEKTGVKVKIVPSSYRNIKITTPEDLAVAQAFFN